MSTPRNAVGWFEIYVRDMDRAKAFYEQTFQVTLEHLPSPALEMWMFPGSMEERPGASGALVKMAGKDPGVGGVLIYFSCADCAVEAARAAQSGGQVHLEKTSIGEYGYMALVHDTEGNMVGLHSLR